MKTTIYLRIAALLLTAGLATVTRAGENVPIRGTLEGSFSITMNPGLPPIGNITGSGTGHAAHLGAFTYEFPHTVDFGVVPPIGDGTYTFTAANGSTLIGEFEGISTPIEPGVLLVEETVVITGGTGRFEGATGELHIVRLVFRNEGTTEGYFEGTISSPGAAKKG
jgi:hypothetical protein